MGDFDILHFDQLHLDAPVDGGFIHDLLQRLIDRIALLENLVEYMLADDVAQGRQGDLIDRLAEIFDGDDRLSRIDDLVPEHRVHLHRDAVPGDGFLLLDLGGDGADVDDALPVDERNDPVKPRPFDLVQAP